MRADLGSVMCKLIPTGMVAAVLAAAVATAEPAAAEPPLPRPDANSDTGAAPAVMGTFTGAYANGVPVYRLPSVSVTASKKEQLAKIAEEDRLAAMQRKRLRTGTQLASVDSRKPSTK